jgi:hypothetical protein
VVGHVDSMLVKEQCEQPTGPVQGNT